MIPIEIEEELRKHKRDVAFVADCNSWTPPNFAIHTMKRIIFASFTDALEYKNKDNFQLYSEILYCELREQYVIAYTTPSILYIKALKISLEEKKLKIERQLKTLEG